MNKPIGAPATVDIIFANNKDVTSYSCEDLLGMLTLNFHKKSILACFDDKETRVFDYHTEKLLVRLDEEDIKAIVVISDEEIVYLTDWNATVYNVNTKHKRVSNIDMNIAIVFQRCGYAENTLLLLYNSEWESYLIQWNLITGKQQVFVVDLVRDITVLDADTVVFARQDSTCTYDLNAKLETNFQYSYAAKIFQLTKFEYITTTSTSIKLVHAVHGAMKNLLYTNTNVFPINDNYVLVERADDHEAEFVSLNIRTGKVKPILTTKIIDEENLHSMVHDGRLFYMNSDRRVEVIDLETTKQIKMFREQFSPSCKGFAVW
jgi:hypothetical protein